MKLVLLLLYFVKYVIIVNVVRKTAAYTFIDNKRAVPASKVLCNSSYNLGFIGTYENLERSVILQHILFIYEFRVTQHYTAISRTFSKVIYYFSNSLIIHQVTNQSGYANLVRCVWFETPMKHWTEAFPR